LHKSAEKLKVLKKLQAAGDFSIEMSRQISVLSYHMEVLKNRINGNFTANYRIESEFEVPKNTRK